ncbi:MAG: DUF938 domain-containing protein [Pseudomonadota bacterium]
MTRDVPRNASVVTQVQGPKLVAPSVARNYQALRDALDRTAPKTGHALEIASGTGEHIAGFATCWPDLEWQPTEPDRARRDSIDAYCAGLSNVRRAKNLNATAPGWGNLYTGQDLILLVNLLHLISKTEAQILISETSHALGPDGRFIFYGPFMRSGKLTSEGDQRFHASLTRHDPEIGYKDDGFVLECLETSNLELVEIAEMPANNVTFISKKPVT